MLSLTSFAVELTKDFIYNVEQIGKFKIPVLNSKLCLYDLILHQHVEVDPINKFCFVKKNAI